MCLRVLQPGILEQARAGKTTGGIGREAHTAALDGEIPRISLQSSEMPTPRGEWAFRNSAGRSGVSRRPGRLYGLHGRCRRSSCPLGPAPGSPVEEPAGTSPVVDVLEDPGEASRSIGLDQLRLDVGMGCNCPRCSTVRLS